jgi:hypothetical protein
MNSLQQICGDNAGSESESYGQCTLPAGHAGGHLDADNGHQWYSRVDDYGPGAYSSIQPFDKGWRHERKDCPYVTIMRRSDMSQENCPTCVRAERDDYKAAVMAHYHQHGDDDCGLCQVARKYGEDN